MPEKNEIIIYTTPDGKETFEVNLKKDTIWLDAHPGPHHFCRLPGKFQTWHSIPYLGNPYLKTASRKWLHH